MEKEVKTMRMEDIVPEYRSRIWIVKNLFWKRIKESVNLADINDNLKVLDVGCGEGFLLREIRKRNEKCELHGSDINLNIKKLSIDADLRIADVRNLPYRDDYFDVVFALDVLEHINEMDLAIKEIKRVLKRDGKLIITAPTESGFYKLGRFIIKGTFSEKEGPCSTHFCNSKEVLLNIKSRGFKLVKLRNLPPIPFLTMFKLGVFENKC